MSVNPVATTTTNNIENTTSKQEKRPPGPTDPVIDLTSPKKTAPPTTAAPSYAAAAAQKAPATASQAAKPPPATSAPKPPKPTAAPPTPTSTSAAPAPTPSAPAAAAGLTKSAILLICTFCHWLPLCTPAQERNKECGPCHQSRLGRERSKRERAEARVALKQVEGTLRLEKLQAHTKALRQRRIAQVRALAKQRKRVEHLEREVMLMETHATLFMQGAARTKELEARLAADGQLPEVDDDSCYTEMNDD